MGSTDQLTCYHDDLFPHETGLLTAKQVAEALAISEKTVYAYVAKGLIPYVKIQSNIRFRTTAIREWIKNKEFVSPVSRGTSVRRTTWN